MGDVLMQYLMQHMKPGVPLPTPSGNCVIFPWDPWFQFEELVWSLAEGAEVCTGLKCLEAAKGLWLRGCTSSSLQITLI